jgi:hypothetical protein
MAAQRRRLHSRIDRSEIMEQNANMFRRGDPRPTGYAWRQMTLGKLMRAGVMCRIRCQDCGREITHSPIWLVTLGNSMFGDTLYDIAQRLVCRRCGSRRVGIETAPD